MSFLNRFHVARKLRVAAKKVRRSFHSLRDRINDFLDQHVSPHHRILSVATVAALIFLNTTPYGPIKFAAERLGKGGEGLSSFIKLLLALFVAYYAAFINRKNKIVDVIIQCANRYDAIAQERSKVESEDGARSYYRRYWGLKSDELDFWMSGLVDPETIFSWFFQVMDAFERNQSISGISYELGWVEAQHTHGRLNPRLVLIVEEIKKLAQTTLDDQSKILELIEILRKAELAERSYRRFSDTNFLVFFRLQGQGMAAYMHMEKKRRDKMKLQKEWANAASPEAPVLVSAD